jgi:hypothetical protein
LLSEKWHLTFKKKRSALKYFTKISPIFHVKELICLKVAVQNGSSDDFFFGGGGFGGCS